MFVDGKYISGKLKGKKVRWYSKDGQRDGVKEKVYLSQKHNFSLCYGKRIYTFRG